MIQQLPSWALTIEAQANDDELAEMLAGAASSVDTGPRLSEYTPLVARMDRLTDAMSELIVLVASVAGGKPGKPRPAKRPETAFTRAERRAETARHESLVDEVAQAQQRWAEKHPQTI